MDGFPNGCSIRRTLRQMVIYVFVSHDENNHSSGSLRVRCLGTVIAGPSICHRLYMVGSENRTDHQH
jgi:hypothetical protein